MAQPNRRFAQLSTQLLGVFHLLWAAVWYRCLLPLQLRGSLHSVYHVLTAGEHRTINAADHGWIGHTDEGVAALEVASQVGEGQTRNEGRQPERDVGDLHRHQGEVHAVDAAFEYEPPQQVAILRLL